MSPDLEQHAFNTEHVDLAAEALLREHPDALVCGLSSDGLIVPIPKSVGLWGQAAIEGRAAIDNVVAEDRVTVVELWRHVKKGGAANGKVRLTEDPSRWVTLHFLDLRDAHDVLLCVIIPGEAVAEGESAPANKVAAAVPRFCTLIEDEAGNVLECDDAFAQMFGYSAEEMIGKPALDQLHPDDQGRAVEGWLAMLATRRPQHMRCRRARKDGTYMWIDTTLHNYLNQPSRNHVLVEIIDVSVEMKAHETVQRQGELLRRLTDAMPDGLLQVDGDHRVVYHNARLLQILGREPDDGSPPAPYTADPEAADTAARSLGRLLSSLSEEGSSTFEDALTQVLGEGIDLDVEVDVVPANGEWRRALMSVRALLGSDGEVTGAITSVLDVTDSARARQELEHRATFDSLTHCHNRSSILDALERELEAATRTETAVVYVDLDRFKQVNDTLGHAAGDDVLVMVAERLKAATRHGGNRTEDSVGRLGGDEFLLLIRGLPEPEIAMGVATRVRESLVAPLELPCGKVELSASLGVAWADAQTTSADQLIRRADEAMYRSKEQRQGRPVLADTPPAAHAA
jgi:diguanylate cyclase (GGDEF)-like protein/PAS domain S-box-containing protein